MLDKAVAAAAVKADKTKALDQFNKGTRGFFGPRSLWCFVPMSATRKIFTAASAITSKPWFSEDRLRAGTTSRSEGCKAARSHGDLAALLSGSTRCR